MRQKPVQLEYGTERPATTADVIGVIGIVLGFLAMVWMMLGVVLFVVWPGFPG